MSSWCEDENAVRGGRRFPGDAAAWAVLGALLPAEGGVHPAFGGSGPAQKDSHGARAGTFRPCHCQACCCWRVEEASNSMTNPWQRKWSAT